MQTKGQSLTLFASTFGLLVLATSCSLIVGAPQCKTTSDCTERGAEFAGSICSSAGVCVKTPTGQRCTTNQECIARNGGEPAICRRDRGECASLISEDCSDVVGGLEALASDEALVFGFMSPLKDDTFGGAIFAKQDANALRLAQEDFAGFAGLPPVSDGKARRTIAFVACDDSVDAVRAAEHLVYDIGVKGLIGNAYSGVTLEVANTVSIPNDVLQISQSATSTLITDLDDRGLVWRTAPSDALQAKVQIALLHERVEPSVRTALGLGAEPLRLSIVNKEDSYGKALSSLLLSGVRYNGDKSALENQRTGHFLQIGYGDSNSLSAEELKERINQAVAAALRFAPQIVFVVGTGEGVDFIASLEAAWQDSSARPFYILGDGVPGRRLVTLLEQSLPEHNIKARILGTTPGSFSERLEAFNIRYRATFPEDEWLIASGTLATFDAAYVLAYSAVANGAEAVTGTNLARSISRLLPPGQPIDVGFNGINAAVSALDRGENIDLVGVSGPLDFDPQTGDCDSDYQIWCPNEASGYYVTMIFEASTSRLSEPLPCP